MKIADAENEKQPAYGTGDASFQAAGGIEGVRQLVEDFYYFMETLPEAKTIREMHDENLEDSKEKLGRFLCGWLGGPKLYQRKFGSISIPGAHRHLGIGVRERDAWLLCMQKALERQPYKDDFKEYIIRQLFVPAERSRTKD